MIPASLVGLTLFVLAVAPGWVWVRVAEKRQVRPDRSPLLEAAELVVTGVIFTTVAAAVVARFGNGVSWIPELRELTARGSTFTQEEPYRTAATAAIVFALSLAAAYGTARLVHRGKEASLVPAGSVWRDVFGEGGEGRPIFVSVTLVDGRVVDGTSTATRLMPGAQTATSASRHRPMCGRVSRSSECALLRIGRCSGPSR